MDEKSPPLPERKSLLLQAVFIFNSTEYTVCLKPEGLQWSRPGGRAHSVGIENIICCGRRKTANGGFQVVVVVPKSEVWALGPQKDKVLVFEPRNQEETQVKEIDRWMAAFWTAIDAYRRIPPKKKLVILVNPFSGPGNALTIWKDLNPLFTVAETPFELITTTHAGHAKEFCSKMDLSQYYGIATVSGDGLLNEAINGIMERPDFSTALQTLNFGIIPGGSGNGLAGSIGVPDPYYAALEIIANRTMPLDLYQFNQGGESRYGFLGVEWSNLAVIDLESDDYRWMGPVRFDMKGVAVIVAGNSYKGKLSFVPEKWDKNTPTFNSPKQEIYETIPAVPNFKEDKECLVIDDRFSFFFAANTSKVMISPGHLAPHAQLSDGCLDIMIARNLGSVELGILLAELESGGLAKNPDVQYYKTKAFELEPDLNDSLTAPIGLDGEPTKNTKISVHVIRACLNLFCHPSNLTQ